MPGKHAMVRSEAVVCSALRLYDSLLAAQCCRGYHGAAAADKRLARAAAVYLTMSGIPVHHSLDSTKAQRQRLPLYMSGVTLMPQGRTIKP
jgi:hypothetical protein